MRILAVLAFVLISSTSFADTSERFGKGGWYKDFQPEIARVNARGELFRIKGHCQSLCTLFLGLRNVGHHGAGGERAGAVMRTGAEGDALLGIAGDVETVRLGKAGLVAVGRAEHEEHAVLRLEIDAGIAPWLGDAARRHLDRRDP